MCPFLGGLRGGTLKPTEEMWGWCSQVGVSAACQNLTPNSLQVGECASPPPPESCCLPLLLTALLCLFQKVLPPNKGVMASVSGISGDCGTELLQQGCGSRLPPTSLTDEDTAAHPSFTNLLSGLSQHMDPSGLSTPLARQMEQVSKELRLQRAGWLRWEVVHRLLQEMAMELGAGMAPQDRKFLETLEQQMLVSELNRVLDLGLTPDGDRRTLLGLSPSDLLQLQPPGQDLALLRERLPVMLEERLRRKCLVLLSYHRPESDGAGETVRSAMLWTLAEGLVGEQQCLREAQARHQELMGLLERQRAAYPQVLLRCLALLKRLAREYRLNTQSELDRLNAQYLETKCSAMFLKIRLEELSILSETYTPEKIEVHRVIRDSLKEALWQQEQALAISRKSLVTYETLGPEFEGLVQEYTKLRNSVDSKRWALAEFNKSCK
uniref:HAUS augmin like complex subunit 4 n=1 Tax=Sphenodon punctatus TaxID=8508 RepID=A0A8D0FY79_SPHPU